MTPAAERPLGCRPYPLGVRVVAFASSRGFAGARRAWKIRRKWHFSQWKAPVNQHVAHAQLIATYKRAQADAAHKQGLIKAVAAKGPKAIQAAVDTAAKAAKRRDGYAQKLAELGVALPD